MCMKKQICNLSTGLGRGCVGTDYAHSHIEYEDTQDGGSRRGRSVTSKAPLPIQGQQSLLSILKHVYWKIWGKPTTEKTTPNLPPKQLRATHVIKEESKH